MSSRSGTQINRMRAGSNASGFTDTDMMRVDNNDDEDEMYTEENFLRRLEEPSDSEMIKNRNLTVGE
jgi:hypothetical protein